MRNRELAEHELRAQDSRLSMLEPPMEEEEEEMEMEVAPGKQYSRM